MIPANDIDVHSLPSVRYRCRQELPEFGAIYFVLSGNVIVYVGQSSNLNKRFVCHEVRGLIGNLNRCWIAWLANDNEAERLLVEADCIKKLRPKINRSGHWRPKPVDLSGLSERIVAIGEAYTPSEAAVLVGGISRSRVSQMIKAEMEEGVHYQRLGTKHLVIFPSGMKILESRKTKPGPASSK